MNIKLWLSSLLLSVTIIAANQPEKIAQLDELTEAIIAQDKKISDTLDRLQKRIKVLENRAIEQNNAITQNEFYEFYSREVEKFVQDFTDSTKDKFDVLFDDSILGEDSALLKFYIIVFTKEKEHLTELLRQWALLANELSQNE